MMDADNRSPEEIERDIERTREDFSSTIDAIQHKLTPREMMDRAVDYALTTTPGAFSVNLVNSVRENPIPVTLIGIGIAWLMTAGRRDDRSMAYRQRMGMGAGYYPEGLYDGDYDDQYGDAAMSRPNGGVMRRAASRASETAQDLKNRASETAYGLNQRVTESASAVAGRVQQATQSAKSTVAETAAQAQARLNMLSKKSQDQLYRAKDKVGHMVDEQPLVVGALGIAFGALLGAMLQPTRRENELMGSVRDDLMERAKETAMEQAEAVKQSAQRVAETARQEADRVKSGVAHGGGGPATSSSAGTDNVTGATGSPSIH